MQYFIRLKTDRKIEVSEKNFASIKRLVGNDAARGIELDDGMTIRMSAVDCVWPELTEEELRDKKRAEAQAKKDLLDRRKKDAEALKAAEKLAKNPVQKPATPKA